MRTTRGAHAIGIHTAPHQRHDLARGEFQLDIKRLQALIQPPQVCLQSQFSSDAGCTACSPETDYHST